MDSNDTWTFKHLNENCLIAKPNGNSDPETLINTIKTITSTHSDGVIEIIPGLDSIGIIYDPIVVTWVELSQMVVKCHSDKIAVTHDVRNWEIPVCYDPKYGLDMVALSQKLALSIEDIIKLHTESRLKVFMKGFLPGFMYLGHNSLKLKIGRMPTPRLIVPNGSIAIADTLTGIYNLKSPGGWHIIGRTPMHFFDVHQSPPMKIELGDIVTFFPITIKEYLQMLPS